MTVTKKSDKTFTLNNGNVIPALGLGSWQSKDEEAYNAVLVAIKTGYRHIDTASGYGNEEVIGKAIKDSGIPREELFVTTKLWCCDHTHPEEALDTSLKKLGLEYVDLYLIHWPVALNPNGNHPLFPTLPNGNRDILKGWDVVKTYQLLQRLVEKGKTKSIGVSNFSITNLKRLLEAPTTKIKPVVNQVELHPYLPQHKLLQFSKENDIFLEAYSPLGSTSSPLLKDNVIVQIGEKYKVSPATILISWALWRGTIVLPKSVNPERIESNFNIVELSDEDGEELNNLHKIRGIKRFISPNWHPVVVFDSDE